MSARQFDHIDISRPKPNRRRIAEGNYSIDHSTNKIAPNAKSWSIGLKKTVDDFVERVAALEEGPAMGGVTDDVGEMRSALTELSRRVGRLILCVTPLRPGHHPSPATGRRGPCKLRASGRANPRGESCPMDRGWRGQKVVVNVKQFGCKYAKTCFTVYCVAKDDVE
jgi:hypothetical protein